jgi:hypothetical protein
MHLDEPTVEPDRFHRHAEQVRNRKHVDKVSAF